MHRYCEGMKYLFSNIMPDKHRAFTETGLSVEVWLMAWMKTGFSQVLSLPKCLLFFDYWLLCGDISFFRLALVGLHRTVNSSTTIEAFDQREAFERINIGEAMDNFSLSYHDIATMLDKHQLS